MTDTKFYNISEMTFIYETHYLTSAFITVEKNYLTLSFVSDDEPNIINTLVSHKGNIKKYKTFNALNNDYESITGARFTTLNIVK